MHCAESGRIADDYGVRRRTGAARLVAVQVDLVHIVVVGRRRRRRRQSPRHTRMAIVRVIRLFAVFVFVFVTQCFVFIFYQLFFQSIGGKSERADSLTIYCKLHELFALPVSEKRRKGEERRERGKERERRE